MLDTNSHVMHMYQGGYWYMDEMRQLKYYRSFFLPLNICISVRKSLTLHNIMVTVSKL